MTKQQRNHDVAIADCGVVIVGGTSGVGHAAAHAFAVAGVRHIALVGRSRDRGEKVRKEIGSIGHTPVEFLAGDARDGASVLQIADEALQRLGRVDVLINATSAVHLPTLFHRTEVDAIPAILSDLVLPPLLMSRALLPDMRSHASGCIINVASDAAKVPTPGEAVIGAAMAAIVTFSKTLAMEAQRDGVRVNVLTPSLIEGTGTADRLFADDFSTRLFSKARDRAGLGVSTPQDQAALMIYLAGPGGRRITGQAISINGGISAA